MPLIAVRECSAPQVDQPECVVALHAAQPAALVQRIGQHFVVPGGLGRRYGEFERGDRPGVVARRLVDVTFAAVHAGLQPAAAGQREPRGRTRQRVARPLEVAFRVVVAQRQQGTNFEVGVGLRGEPVERLGRQPVRLFRFAAARPDRRLHERCGIVRGDSRRVRPRRSGREARPESEQTDDDERLVHGLHCDPGQRAGHRPGGGARRGDRAAACRCGNSGKGAPSYGSRLYG